MKCLTWECVLISQVCHELGFGMAKYCDIIAKMKENDRVANHDLDSENIQKQNESEELEETSKQIHKE